jgi:hypothetical protein
MGQVVLVPEQNEAGVYSDPLQLAGAHIAVDVWHMPAPSQTFVLPQPLAAAPQRVSVMPEPRGAQVPWPLMLQAWQAGQLALPQQTPSTQLPWMHSLPAEQVAPFAFRLQFLTVLVPWQVYGIWQSPSAVHVVLHALVLASQTYCMQPIVGAAPHMPVPLQ